MKRKTKRTDLALAAVVSGALLAMIACRHDDSEGASTAEHVPSVASAAAKSTNASLPKSNGRITLRSSCGDRVESGARYERGTARDGRTVHTWATAPFGGAPTRVVLTAPAFSGRCKVRIERGPHGDVEGCYVDLWGDKKPGTPLFAFGVHDDRLGTFKDSEAMADTALGTGEIGRVEIDAATAMPGLTFSISDVVTHTYGPSSDGNCTWRGVLVARGP